MKISDLKDILYQLSLSSDEFGGTYQNVRNQLDDSQGSLSSTKDAFDLVCTALKDAGVPLDELETKLMQEFPKSGRDSKKQVLIKILLVHSRQ